MTKDMDSTAEATVSGDFMLAPAGVAVVQPAMSI